MSDPSRKFVTGEAAGIALAIRKFAGLAQVKNPQAPAVRREAEEDWRR
jgi:hypothetical protein